MSDRRIDKLKATYRQRWDSHQLIADHNARLVQVGKQPSNEQLINEQRAAEAVAAARDEVMAAISRSTASAASDGPSLGSSIRAVDAH
jgi:hypothetical protein